ncbi:MAG: carboxypeptidase M32, partial [Myxococcales bacterium]|nr:carboxypeptidase M32 [Myxococcales bacterium]
MSATPAYDALHQHFARVGHLEEALEYLYWDMATQMPEGGAQARGEQLATLKVLEHQLSTDPRIGDWIARAEGEDLDGWQRANVRECHRLWTHATAVPEALVEAQTKANSACGQIWRTARPKNDFKAVAPYLTEVFARAREVAQIKGEIMGLDPYDALLDGFEPGARRAQIAPLFDDLAAFLPGFTDQVLDAQARRGHGVFPTGPFPIATQRDVGLHFMGVLGFDLNHGRLDVSAHPFCGGGAADVRITTRYREDDFIQSLMGVLHETGHALYEQGRPLGWRAQPVGRARSAGVHESQSLLMEMQACRSREFIELASPVLARHFGGDPTPWAPDNLYRIYTHVERGLIRVDAD